MKTITGGFHSFLNSLKGLKAETINFKKLAFLFLLGCSPLVISAQFSISFGVTEPTCWGGSDGFITANVNGGTGPFTFKWSTGQTTQTIDGVRAGDYSVTVTDANQNSKSASVEVVQPPQLKGTFSFSDCNYPTVVTVTAKGGWAPYTYKWDNGTLGDTLHVTEPGKYCVTIIDANNCARVECVLVELKGLEVEVNMDMITCPGDTDGELKVTIIKGTGPYTFEWSNGGTGPIISNLPPGDYTVTVTDNAGCKTTATGTVKDKPDLKINCVFSDPVCTGDENGFIEVSVSGGTAPYTYLWNTGETTASIDGLGTGTYSVTVTDANGCTIEKEQVLFPLSSLVILGSATPESCPGENDGVLMAQGASGEMPYSYLWSNGAVSATVTGVAPGEYSVTVTDALGCSKEATLVVEAADPFDAQLDVTPIASCEGNDGMLEVLVSPDTAVVSYLWSTGDTTAKITDLGAGEYSVTVINENECEIILDTILKAPPVLEVDVSATLFVCPDDSTGQAMAMPIGGTAPFDFNWSNGDTTQAIAELSAGTYIVTVVDANDCMAVDSVTINESPEILAVIDATDVACGTATDGTASVIVDGGVEPYTYMWSTGDTTAMITGLSAGEYCVTVKDFVGCMEILCTTILADSLELSLVGTNIDCFGDSTGTVMAIPSNGMEPYDYLWSTGETTAGIDGLKAGEYSVTVTDAKGCEAADTIVLTQPDTFKVVVADLVDVDCFGDSTGSVTVMAMGGTGPYTFSWTDGETGETGEPEVDSAEELCEGLDDCEVGIAWEDCSGFKVCLGKFDISNIVIDMGPTGFQGLDPDDPDVRFQLTTQTFEYTAPEGEVINGFWIKGPDFCGKCTDDPATYGCVDCEGDACPEGNGGGVYYKNPNAPCDGTGETPGDMNTRDSLKAGIYKVIVTDSLGCMAMVEIEIGQSDSIGLTLESTNLDCAGDSTGTISAFVTGGTKPFTFAWSNGADTSELVDLAAGTYVLTLTDDNGCSIIDSVTVTEPDTLKIEITNLRGACEDLDNGELVVTASGGVGPYSYLWSNLSVNDTIKKLAPGEYSVTVTDANGCVDSLNTLVEEYPALECSITILQNESSPGAQDGRASVDVTGGVEPFTYLWSNGQTTQEATGLGAGDYSVTVTDANGCTTSCEINLLILSGLGNYVWEDINRDGIQDEDEPGVPDIPVKLKDKDDNIISRDTTDENGFYSFLDLLPDTYSVMFDIDSVNYNYTIIDEGSNDSVDSDVNFDNMQMTPQVTLASGEFNNTLDAGIYRRPAIGMDPCECLNNATLDGNGQFSERITVMSYPNEIWRVVDITGLYKPDSPEPPAAPIPIEVGTELTEFAPGMYELPARLVDGEVYIALSTNNFAIDTIFTTNVCVYPRLNMDDIPGDSICVVDPSLELSSNPSIPGEVKYFLNGEEITEIDPSILEEGDYEFIAQLIPFDPDECEARILKQITIHNECLAMIGDTVWLDQNRNGLQDPSEVGIGGVQVIAQQVGELNDSLDNLFRDTMFTDENGKYLFTVPPGIYKVTFGQPDGLIPTTANAGDDTRDSDIDPETLMTGLYVVNVGDVNLTIDAGFYDFCVNVTDPGAIGYDQMLCGPGQDPDPIIGIRPPEGGEGELIYLWMKSTTSAVFNNRDWMPIPNSNSPNYDPGPLYETTYFTRCVRRENCAIYLEPDPVTIKVNEFNQIDIVVEGIACVGKPLTLRADTDITGSFTWEFDGPATPSTSRGKSTVVTFNDFGRFEVRVFANVNGCVVSQKKTIQVYNSPTFCGTGLSIDLEVENDRDISIAWSVADDGTEYVFEVERSADGYNFEKIATVTEPKEVVDQYKHYEYMDTEAKKGRNYYQVKIYERSLGNLAFTSDMEEIIVFGESKLLLVYPNPVINDLNIEVFESLGEPVQVELFTINGVLLQRHELEPDTRGINLNLENYPMGTYFLKVQFGKTLVKRFKLVRY